KGNEKALEVRGSFRKQLKTLDAVERNERPPMLAKRYSSFVDANRGDILRNEKCPHDHRRNEEGQPSLEDHDARAHYSGREEAEGEETDQRQGKRQRRLHLTDSP